MVVFRRCFERRNFVVTPTSGPPAPISEIAAVLTERNQEALLLSSPFILADGIDFKNEVLRRRIGQAAKRIAARAAPEGLGAAVA
jgi:hypothetical protein